MAAISELLVQNRQKVLYYLWLINILWKKKFLFKKTVFFNGNNCQKTTEPDVFIYNYYV